MQPIYCCIDLKSFYASVECVEMGYDPFKVNLVVADASRGNGAITLAISPAMKAAGVKNRCRLYEIPEDMEYVCAMPRMKLYMEKSAQIYGIYLQFVAPEDIHVYSIDEVFIDATQYLTTYHCNAEQFVRMLMDAVYQKTGITATGGIGTNLYLAKIAMDIIAKHVPSHIGYLDEKLYQEQLWHHQPLTDFWNVGYGTASRLAKYNVYDMYGITQLPESLLKKEFGVKSEFLIDHAYGREPCTMAEIHAYKGKNRSLSNSQILFEDYDCKNAEIIVKEMVENLGLELLDNNLYAKGISLYIGYSKDCCRATGGSMKIETTCSMKKLQAAFNKLYWDKVRVGYPIRQLGISLSNLTYEPDLQLSLWEEPENNTKEENLMRTVLQVRKRMGKNAVLKGFNLCEKATGRYRNETVGGHHG